MKEKLIAAFTDEALHERVRRQAFEENCSRSEIVRRAVEEYLARRKGKKG